MFGLLGDVLRVVTAPLVVVEPVVRTVTKPVADVTSDVAREIADSLDELLGGKR